MSELDRYRRRWRSSSSLLLLLVLAFLAGAGCDDGPVTLPPPGPFQLTFALDASFQAPHGDQPISIAVVRTADALVIARGSGTVSATQTPSYSFSAGDVLERGIAVEVHYWIDSNIGGGTLGICDPRAIDHQWSVEFPSPSNDVTFTASHDPALTEDVCGTFR